MASFDQNQLAIQSAFIDRIRARLTQTMINVMAENVFVNTVYSNNRLGQANFVLNNLDDHVDRYSFGVTINSTIQTAYITNRDLNSGDPDEGIQAGIDAITDNDIDFVLAGLVNAFGNINAQDVLNSRKPQNLEAKDITATSVNIVWDRVPGHNSYKQRWRQKGTSTWTNGTSAQNAEIKDITSLTTATTYEAQVSTVYNTSNESNWSDILEFITT